MAQETQPSTHATPTVGKALLAFTLSQIILSFAGASVAGTLWWAHQRNVELACSGEGGGCDLVWNSRWAHLTFGPWHDVPLALLGLAGYLVLLTIAMVKVGAEKASARRLLALTGFVVTIGGAGYSWFLQYVAHFKIGAFCPWCFISACLMTALFLVSVTEIVLTREPAGPVAPQSESTRADLRAKRELRRMLVGSWFGLMVLLVINVIMLARATERPPAPPERPQIVVLPDTGSDTWTDIVKHAVAPPTGASKPAFSIAEFGDFQCPPCGRLRPKLEKVLKESSVNLYFVHCPFTKIHKYAYVAAQASDSAAAQGKFWQMYDELYKNQDDLEPSKYEQYANEVGLNGKRVRADVASGRYVPQVESSETFSLTIAIQFTPTLVVRNNATHELRMVSGKELTKLMKNPPWATSRSNRQ